MKPEMVLNLMIWANIASLAVLMVARVILRQ